MLGFVPPDISQGQINEFRLGHKLDCLFLYADRFFSLSVVMFTSGSYLFPKKSPNHNPDEALGCLCQYWAHLSVICNPQQTLFYIYEELALGKL